MESKKQSIGPPEWLIHRWCSSRSCQHYVKTAGWIQSIILFLCVHRVELSRKVVIVGCMPSPMLQPLPDEPCRCRWELFEDGKLTNIFPSQEAGGILPMVLFHKNVYNRQMGFMIASWISAKNMRGLQPKSKSLPKFEIFWSVSIQFLCQILTHRWN